MHLLNTANGKLKWFDNDALPPYAILSHVWDPHEQSFQDVSRLASTRRSRSPLDPTAPTLKANRDSEDTFHPHISAKIRNCCECAAELGFRWVWLDICCINKRKSDELSEAINSMFAWYANAGVCIAYLRDVPDGDDPGGALSKFSNSRWFARGWTLQELIAPRVVLFMSQGWKRIGRKMDLAPLLANITGIDRAVLTFDRRFSEVCIAERMRWAAYRETTRVEDKAYSLQGLFGVHIPISYGEGDAAFRRLQEEILRQSPDQSLFAWDEHSLRSTGPTGGLLADDVSQFRFMQHIQSIPTEGIPVAVESFRAALARSGGQNRSFPDEPLVVEGVPSFSRTTYGIRAHIPLVRIRNHTTAIAILAVRRESYYVGLLLEKRSVELNAYFTSKTRERRLVHVSETDMLHVLPWPSASRGDVTVSWEDVDVWDDPSVDSATPNGDVHMGFPYRFIPSYVFAKLARHGFFPQYAPHEPTQTAGKLVQCQTTAENSPAPKPGRGVRGVLVFVYHDSSARELGETLETFCVVAEVLVQPSGNYTILHLGVSINGTADLRCPDTPSLWPSASKAFGDEERRVWLTHTRPRVHSRLAGQDIVDIDLSGSVYVDLARRRCSTVYDTAAALTSKLDPTPISIDDPESARLDRSDLSLRGDPCTVVPVALQTHPKHTLASVADRNGPGDSLSLLMQTLDEVVKVYPFTSGAVEAFAAAVQLESERGVGDGNVGVAMHAMRDMMTIFARLLHTTDGKRVAASLQALTAAIAKDIKACTEACRAVSQQRGFLQMRPNRSGEDESISAFAALFCRRSRELESVLIPPSPPFGGVNMRQDTAEVLALDRDTVDVDTAWDCPETSVPRDPTRVASGADAQKERVPSQSASIYTDGRYRLGVSRYPIGQRGVPAYNAVAVDPAVRWSERGRRSWKFGVDADPRAHLRPLRGGDSIGRSFDGRSERELRASIERKLADASRRLRRMECLMTMTAVLFVALVAFVFVCWG